MSTKIGLGAYDTINPGAQILGMTQTAYLDYAATTPVDPRVVDKMNQCLGVDGIFANASSATHAAGHEALAVVNEARDLVAALIGVGPHEIIWTSGATEAINLAIKGILRSPTIHGCHVVTSCLEHSAVLDTCRALECGGLDVTVLSPDPHGQITTDIVAPALRDDTALVSLMQVNNEVGTATDIRAIGQLVREHGALFHVDAAQGTARLPLDAPADGIDLLSLSAHKFYGPKGVGALYIRDSLQSDVVPMIHGGAQERGLRAGTLPTHQLAGMGEAARLVLERRAADCKHVAALETRLFRQLAAIDCVVVNGNPDHRVPGLINVAFPCVASEALLIALRDKVALSSGSACTSTQTAPSHVLHGLGVPDDLAMSSVRISVGRFTTAQEIDFATACLHDAVAVLRALSPAWEAHRAQNTTICPFATGFVAA